jgi:hypothetical protein
MLQKHSFIPFQSSWDRIKRAEAHSYAFRELGNSLTTSDFHTTALDIDDGGAGTFRYIPKNSTIPRELPLLLGEMLYQLQGALDGAVCDAAAIDSNRSPRPDISDLRFPICLTARQFEQCASTLGHLSHKRRAFIHSLQPYHGSSASPEGEVMSLKRTLGIMKRWLRIDHCRPLHIVSSWIVESSPRLTLPASVHLKNMRVQRRGFLAKDDVVARFRLKGYAKGMDVQVSSNLQFHLTVDELPPPCHLADDLSARMNMMLLTAKEIVRTIEGC